MTQQKLEKCNKIAKEIDQITIYLKEIKWMINDNVIERPMDIRFSGCDSYIVAPSEVFKTIGKLLYNEYQQKLMKLEMEFWNL